LIEAEGSLGIEVAAEMKALLLEAASSGLETQLDVSRATSIDASCLQLLWAATNRTESATHTLTVVGDIPPSIDLAMITAGFHDPMGPIARKTPHDSPIMLGDRAND